MAAIHWDQPVDGNWNEAIKWLTGAVHRVPLSTDDVTIAAPSASYTVSLTDAETAKTLTVDQSVAELLEANTGALSLSGALTIKHGVVQLDAANTIGGGVFLNGGQLLIGNAGALGSGLVTITGGELRATNTVALPNILSMSGSFTLAAADGKTLNLVDDSWSLVESAGSTVTIGAPGAGGGVVVRGNDASITNGGLGHVHIVGSLVGADDGFSFFLENSADTLLDADAHINVVGHDATINRLQGEGEILNSGGIATLTLHGQSTFAGTIIGALSPHIAGTNARVVLTGSNSYTIGTTIDAATTLALGNGGTTGSIAGGALNTITDNGTLEINRSNAVSLTNVISGSGDLVLRGTGTTTINHPNSYSGATNIDFGTAAIGSSGALGQGQVAIESGGTLLATADIDLANKLRLVDDATIAAAPGTTLKFSGSQAWSRVDTGAHTIFFGAPGQDGTVIWHTFGTPSITGADPHVEVRAGILQASDNGLGALLGTVNGLTTVDAGASIDLAGHRAVVTNLRGTGSVESTASGESLLSLVRADFSGSISAAGTPIVLAVAGSSRLAGTTNIAEGTIASGQTLTNDGTFTLLNGNLTGNDAAARVVNDGLFTVGAGAHDVTARFVNPGFVHVAVGSVQFKNGFDNIGLVQGLLTHNGNVFTVAANASGETTFFGGTGDNLLKVATAPSLFDGGGGDDTVEVTANMTFAAGSLISIETVKIDDHVNGDLSHLNVGVHIVLASKAGGDASAIGTRASDVVTGGDGRDLLDGNLGNDTLSGGANKDIFRFNTVLNAKTNLDHIVGFSVADDTIELDNAIFTKLHKTGPLKSKFFHIGKKAADHNDFIIYNKKSGALFYDSDGSKHAHGKIEFAQLDAHLHLTSHDLLMI